MPEVTVVIPAYNAGQSVGAAVDSVLGQTVADVDVIVVDDGSDDDTAGQAERGARVEVVRTANRGVSAARNEGIARARGRFVAFLDADDLWEPTKLERQLEALEREPDAPMATCGSREVDERGATLAVWRPWESQDACRDMLLHSMVLGHVSSAVIPRDRLEGLGGFDKRFSQCADWDFFLRAALAGRPTCVPEPLVIRRIHGDNMSSDIGLLERDTFAVLDKFFALPEAGRYESLRREAYSNHWIILSGSFLHSGSPLASVRCMAAGLRLHPANIRRPLGAPSRWIRRLAGRSSSTEQPAQ